MVHHTRSTLRSEISHYCCPDFIAFCLQQSLETFSSQYFWITLSLHTRTLNLYSALKS